jgi:hypothetical protein
MDADLGRTLKASVVVTGVLLEIQTWYPQIQVRINLILHNGLGWGQRKHGSFPGYGMYPLVLGKTFGKRTERCSIHEHLYVYFFLTTCTYKDT